MGGTAFEEDHPCQIARKVLRQIICKVTGRLLSEWCWGPISIPYRTLAVAGILYGTRGDSC